MRLPYWFYLIGPVIATLITGLCFLALFTGWSFFFDSGTVGEYWPLALLAINFWGFTFFLTFIYDSWDSVKEYDPIHTPRDVVFGLVIPFVQIAFLWNSTVGLAETVNSVRRRKGLSSDRFPPGIAKAFFGFTLLSFCVPPLAILSLAALTVFVMKISANVNALIPKDLPIGEAPPQLQWDARLILAIMIASIISGASGHWLIDKFHADTWTLRIIILGIAATPWPLAFWPFLKKAHWGTLGLIWLAALTLAIGSRISYVLPTELAEHGVMVIDIFLFTPLFRSLLFAAFLFAALKIPFWLTFGTIMLSSFLQLLIMGSLFEGFDFRMSTLESMGCGAISGGLEALLLVAPIYHGTRAYRVESWCETDAI